MSRVLLAPLALLPWALLACNTSGSEACGDAQRLWVGSFDAKQQDDLEELRCVEVISGDLRLSGVSSLEPLGSLVQVLGDVVVSGNPALESLQGLESLTEIQGSLRVVDNDALTSLAGLGPIQDLAGLAVEYNDALRDLSGFESLSAVQGAFVVRSNEKLTSVLLGGDARAVSLRGPVEVSSNPSLTEVALAGLDADTVPTVGRHDVYLGDNERLERITFDVGVGRERRVEIVRNAKLGEIASLGPTTYLERLELADLPALSQVALSGVRFGTLELVRTGLTDLTGFGDMAVACELTVMENGALTSVAPRGTEWTGPFAASMTVINNARLPGCQVAGLVAQLSEPRVACPDPFTGLVSRDGREVRVERNDDDAVCE